MSAATQTSKRKATIVFQGYDKPNAMLMLDSPEASTSIGISLDVARQIVEASAETPAFGNALDNYGDIQRVEGTRHGRESYPVEVDPEIAMRLASIDPESL